MPIKSAYVIQRNIRLMLPEYQDWEKKRTEMITEYDSKNANGDFSVPPDKIKEFGDAMNAIGEQEIELDLHTLSIDEYGRDIAPLDLMILDWMFKE
jgi:hypothetical protein